MYYGSKNQTAQNGRQESPFLSYRFIEEIGTYDPTKNPSVINVDVEKANKWIANGAQPTDTVKKILKISAGE